MQDKSQAPSLDNIQKMQIDEWLRQADKLIREGRYLAADDMLQKVTAINPHHDTARAYQDRISFLIKQVSMRVGLSREIQTEIRKYRDLLIQRRSNQISPMLVNAQQMFEEGFYKKASEQANKVLALDPENIYAKALLQRVAEVQSKAGGADINTPKEYKFCAILTESWRNGAPTETQNEYLKTTQQQLGIPEGRRLELEREIRNTLYKEAIRQIWMTGGFSAFTEEGVDNLRKKFQVSRIDHSFIESSLLKELRKNKIKGTILLVEGDENVLLEMTNHLRSNFFAVISASSFDEALASIKTVLPDLIISEVNFAAGPAGFDLYEFIRASPATKNIPFFFLTAELDRTILLTGKRLGVDEFFLKPTDYDLLVATITGKLLKAGSRLTPAKRN